MVILATEPIHFEISKKELNIIRQNATGVPVEQTKEDEFEMVKITVYPSDHFAVLGTFSLQ
jgi:hypothetical protein